MEKHLIIEALKLYLKEKTKINHDDWNAISEFSPYVAAFIAKSFRLNLGEMREYLRNHDLEFSLIEKKIYAFNESHHVDAVTDLLKGIKAGDSVEFNITTNPVAVDRVERSDEFSVQLSFKCRSGYWLLNYKWDGTQLDSDCYAETGIHDVFDIVKVTRN